MKRRARSDIIAARTMSPSDSSHFARGLLYGVGTDLVEIERVRRLVEKYGDRFLKRIYSDAELAEAERRGVNRWEHLAGLFASKEAVLKAMGTGRAQGARFVDVEVTSRASGAPVVRLSGASSERLDAAGGGQVLVSITHDAGLASAFAVIQQVTERASHE